MAEIVRIAQTRVPQAPVRLSPLAAALGIGLGIGIVPAALAATFTVINLNDSGAGSLRQAVIDANTAAGADTVAFQAGLTGTITLTSGQIAITDSVTITGPGAPSMTLTKSGAASRIFNITNTPTVTISGLTFTGAGGAGIKGGAIAQANGTLTVQASVFTNNTAANGGGALYTANGTLSVSDSTFTGNSVGVVNDGGNDGGALYIRTGTVTIQNTTISGNFCGNDGGGIYHANGILTVNNSTLSNNQAQYGSAISRFNGGTTFITNSTITGNSTFPGFVSSGQGGALFFYGGTITIRNSTIANNSAPNAVGGNIVLYTVDGTSTLNLVSTIVSGGTDRTGNRDLFVYGTGIINADHSLVQNPGAFLNGTVVASITGQNPLLGALASNGGPTQTMSLSAGSPAIDTGSNPSALAFDQRGAGFPRTIGAQTDMGAFESSAAPPPPPVVQVVPTLSQWGTIALSGLMGLWVIMTGFGRRRRRS